MDTLRPPAPDFWVFQTEHDNLRVVNDLRPGMTGTWTIYGRQPELKAGDVAFISLAGPPPSFIGWGFIRQSYAFSNEEEVDDPFTNKYPYGFNTEIDFQASITPHINRSEMLGDPALESLLELQAKFIRVFKIDAAQARALNKLLRARGITAPPEPVDVRADSPEERAAGEGATPGLVTLREALARYKFSPFTQNIVALAGNLAYKRAGSRKLVTTGCLLFAMAETGEREEEAGTSAEFLYSWLKERHWQAYNNEFDRFMRGAAAEDQAIDPAGGKSVPTLTPSATQVIEMALGIAKLVRREEKVIDREVICGRDLLASLLVGSEQGENDAAVCLASMGVDLPELRERLFSFLSHPKNNEDDIDKWRRLLIGGIPLPEDAEPLKTSPPKTFLPRIDADDLKGEDRLGIMAEVRAFASIIAARDVKTPLSIGLFGDWGSGKSFFISKLKEEVARIAGRVRARGAGEETAFLGNVVQIDFNAWHYAEANLWASLVSHVFENLSLSDEHDRRKAEERKRLLLAQLDTTLGARREAESEVAARRREEESARAALKRARREQTDAGLKLGRALGREVWGLVRKQVEERPDVRRVVEDAGARLGRAGLPANLGEFRQELAATRAAAGQAQGYLASVFQDPRRWLKVSLILAATLLVPLAVTYALARWPLAETWGRVVTSVAPLLTLLGGAAAWLRSRRGEVERALSVLGEASRRLDELYESARAEHDREVVELRSKLDAKEAAVRTAAGALAEAERGVRETVSALRELEPGAVLERFVTERAASEDYRKLLGVVALIRRDFKKLSDLLSQQGDAELREAVRRKLLKDREDRKGANEDGGAEPRPDDAEVEKVLNEYRIDRIVLYIDDLDRCPPKQVVDVLQAIHLLLAFELFVVVVGVDARWVRHSLREQFPALLSGEADEGDPHRFKAATPRDYIEKIFQVPFWLRPMSHEGSTDLLLGLIPDSELRPAGADGEGRTGGPRREGVAAGGAGFRVPAGREVAKTPAAGDSPAQATTPTIGATRAEEAAPEAPPRTPGVALAGAATADGEGGALALRPDNLLLEAKERDAMVRLAKVIGRTPRTLKRFVNVYRIIKAGLGGERLEAFMGGDDGGEFRAVLVLLAVAHGAPDIAPAVFHELKGRCAGVALSPQEDTGLKAFLNDMKKTTHASPEVWHRVVNELDKFAGDPADDIPLAVLGRWLPVVVRYTFQLGRMSEEFA